MMKLLYSASLHSSLSLSSLMSLANLLLSSLMSWANLSIVSSRLVALNCWESNPRRSKLHFASCVCGVVASPLHWWSKHSCCKLSVVCHLADKRFLTASCLRIRPPSNDKQRETNANHSKRLGPRLLGVYFLQSNHSTGLFSAGA
jgi:hypothetical protein